MTVDTEVPSPSVAIIHTDCAGIAFRVNHRPAIGEPMRAADVVWPDGVHDHDFITCNECGRICAPGDLIPEGNFWAER